MTGGFYLNDTTMNEEISIETLSPKYGDTKVTIKRLREYDGRWFPAANSVMYFRGKPPKDKMIDAICRKYSKDKFLAIDADIDISDVTIHDYFKHNT